MQQVLELMLQFLQHKLAVAVTAELQPYKYAGYPMLIKTIRMETNDDQLFSKSAPLLSAAAELTYHTVNCSALNAEELRRENGIQVRGVLQFIKGKRGYRQVGYLRVMFSEAY